jgi:hypothetical protein
MESRTPKERFNRIHAKIASSPLSGVWCLTDITIKERMSFTKCETGKMSYILH